MWFGEVGCVCGGMSKYVNFILSESMEKDSCLSLSSKVHREMRSFFL